MSPPPLQYAHPFILLLNIFNLLYLSSHRQTNRSVRHGKAVVADHVRYQPPLADDLHDLLRPLPLPGQPERVDRGVHAVEVRRHAVVLHTHQERQRLPPFEALSVEQWNRLSSREGSGGMMGPFSPCAQSRSSNVCIINSNACDSTVEVEIDTDTRHVCMCISVWSWLSADGAPFEALSVEQWNRYHPGRGLVE